MESLRSADKASTLKIAELSQLNVETSKQVHS